MYRVKKLWKTAEFELVIELAGEINRCVSGVSLFKINWLFNIVWYQMVLNFKYNTKYIDVQIISLFIFM
jgi:hypothetical protein